MADRYSLIHVSDGCALLETRTEKTPIASDTSFEALIAAAEKDLRERAAGDDDLETQVFVMRELLGECSSSRNDEEDEDPSYYVIVASGRRAA